MATTAQVYQLYLAYFGRPPDFTGLNSFANSTPAQVQAIFSASAESRALLGSTDTATQVNNIYQNLFGRDAETAGLAYWVSEIASGRVTLASAAFDILNGARNADATVVANRIEVAQAFVANYSATTAGILGYVGDAAAAQARTFLRTVTDTAASKTAALAGVAAAVTSTVAAGGTTTPVVGSTFTLTTGVDAPSGGAGNDTISGLLGSSGTYTVGDNIAGGSGSDTLNLIATTGTDGDGGLVSINSVETINVRLLTTAFAASAGDELALNAADWVGLTTITNASSLVNTRLDVSGLTDDTVVVLHGNTDISVGYNNTATGATANAVLVNAGSAGTATTIGSASATNTANFDFDEADAGLVTHVNLEVRGSLNLANIEAGSSVTNYTITGTGNAALITDDTITSFDASAAAGNIDITFSGASEVTAKGGAGNDQFRFGSTYTNSDSVDGGAGTDTVVATIGAFNRNLNTTNVEAATLTFTVDSGAAFNASASTVATYTLVAGVASADASISEIANSATINVADNGLDDVTIDAASGAATMTLNLGSSTGQVGIEEIAISDVATLVINANAGSGVSGGTAAFSASGITVDADVRTVVINTSAGETDLVVTDFSGNAISSLTINSNGSGSITLTSALETNTAISAITINAAGSDAADVTVGSIVDGAATADKLTSVTLVGRSGADITIGSLDLGNGATAAASATISMDAGSSSVVGTDVFDISTTGDFDTNITVVAGQSSTIQVGDVTIAAGTAASGASLNIAAFTANTGSFVGIEQATISQSGAQVTVGALVAAQDATIELFGSGGMVATNVADIDIGDIRVTLGASANLLIGTGTAGSAIDTTAGAIGSVTLTIADDATAEIGLIDASSMAGITLSIAGDGAAMFGGVSAGIIGAINVGVAASASATFAAIKATTIESIKVSGAGVVDIGTVSATTVGTIDARQLTSGTFSIDLSGVTNAVEVFVGNSTNTVISGDGNDILTLNNGSGQDNIQYSTALGDDQIIRFGAGTTGGDQIEFFVSAFGDIVAAGSAAAAIATGTVAIGLSFVTAAATLTSTTNVIVLGTGTYSSAGAVADAIGSGGTVLITLGSATAGDLIVAWADTNGDTNITLFEVGANATGIGTAAANDTIAILSGVTPGALVAANFDFV